MQKNTFISLFLFILSITSCGKTQKQNNNTPNPAESSIGTIWNNNGTFYELTSSTELKKCNPSFTIDGHNTSTYGVKINGTYIDSTIEWLRNAKTGEPIFSSLILEYKDSIMYLKDNSTYKFNALTQITDSTTPSLQYVKTKCEGM